jgi:hypothetical protein
MQYSVTKTLSQFFNKQYFFFKFINIQELSFIHPYSFKLSSNNLLWSQVISSCLSSLGLCNYIHLGILVPSILLTWIFHLFYTSE